MSPAGLLRVSEVAELLGVSEKTVEREIHDGKLLASKVRSMWLVRKQDVDSYLLSCRRRGPKAPVPPSSNRLSELVRGIREHGKKGQA